MTATDSTDSTRVYSRAAAAVAAPVAVAEAAAYTRWDWIWLIWFGISAGSFLVIEVYGLLTDPRRTLSWAVWRLLRLRSAQPVWEWSAGHWWFVAGFLALSIWLTGHFGWGLWA